MRTMMKSLVPVLGAAVLLVGASTPASATTEDPDSARGSIKIEETEFRDGGDTPNEVKVGCDFSIDFFGMDEGEVPVTFTLQPPNEEEQFAQRTAQVSEAQGNELSGRLDVDLTDDLSSYEPAQAEDYDYKVRVDAVVKSNDGNSEITKSAMLFIDCAAAYAPAEADEEEAPEEGLEAAPVGGVAAGEGGTASSAAGQGLALLGGAGLLGLAFAYRRRTLASA